MNVRFYLQCLTVIFFCFSYTHKGKKNDSNNNNVVIYDRINAYNDTIINIDSMYVLVLNQCNENGVIRYSNPIIQSGERKRKLGIFMNTSNVDELDFYVSENQKYLVMCYIADNGFVYRSESDSIYHEIYRCSMIELISGKVIRNELSPKECSGQWDINNKWSDGKNVLIDPLND